MRDCIVVYVVGWSIDYLVPWCVVPWCRVPFCVCVLLGLLSLCLEPSCALPGDCVEVGVTLFLDLPWGSDNDNAARPSLYFAVCLGIACCQLSLVTRFVLRLA